MNQHTIAAWFPFKTESSVCKLLVVTHGEPGGELDGGGSPTAAAASYMHLSVNDHRDIQGGGASGETTPITSLLQIPPPTRAPPSCNVVKQGQCVCFHGAFPNLCGLAFERTKETAGDPLLIKHRF